MMKSHTFIINYLLLKLVLILFFIPAPKAQTPGFITGIVKDAGVDTITVLLTQRPVNLNEAEIISGKYKVLKGVNKEVVDYDFIDTDLLVLVRNMNTLKYELIITNDQFDTISKKSISRIKHPKSIFKDCIPS